MPCFLRSGLMRFCRSSVLVICVLLPSLLVFQLGPVAASPANDLPDPLPEGAPALPTVPSLPLVPVGMPSRTDLPVLPEPTLPALPPLVPNPDGASARASKGHAAPAQQTEAPGCTSLNLALKALVITAEPTDSQTTLPAIQQALDYQGTPYAVFTASPRPSDPAANRLAGLLSSNCNGFYSAVILGNGQIAYNDPVAGWRSALTDPEWQTLWSYERTFSVRQVTWYTYPTPEYGFQAGARGLDTTVSPISAQYTPAGRSTFSYANTANPLTITSVWAYQAQPLDSNTSSLLADSQGNALAAIRTYPDGTQNLALSFDSNPYVIHDLVLAYGVLNWASGGTFLGERHAFFSPQVDDLFLDAHVWVEGTACGSDTERNNSFYRMTGDDVQSLITWQTGRQSQPTTASFRLDFAFNGEGTTGIYDPDTLTPALVQDQARFKYINHTFTHENLNAVSYDTARLEISQNIDTATQLGLASFTVRNLVTPDVSGLENPEAMRAAFDLGVRYVVSDASRPGYDNPSPNIGIYNPLQPSILMIPRHPNNLFYNVTNPTQWTQEYNCIYRSFWGRDLTYAELLQNESQVLLRYVLVGDMDPWMFHETNLRAYDGTHMVLTDLLDRILDKYRALFALPVVNPMMDNLGVRMADRMAYRSAGVTATLVPGQQITLHAQNAAVVPITGLRIGNYEVYGGQPISHVSLAAGQTITFPLAPSAGNDSYVVAEGATLNVPAPGVLSNDTDPEGDPLHAVLGTGPTHGTLTLNSNGSFVYTHDGSESVLDSFTYTAQDSTGTISKPATVSLTVTPVNDAPVAVNDAFTMNRLDLSLIVAAPGVLANDTDAEHNPLTAALVTGPAQGTVTLESDGSFRYTPIPGLDSITDSFTYQANDGALNSNVATVTITVNAPNQPTSTPTVPMTPTSPTTSTVAPSGTPVPSSTPLPSGTPTLAPTSTPTPLPSNTPAPSSTPVPSNTPAPSSTPTRTPTRTPAPPVARNDAYAMNRADLVLNVPPPGVLANDTDADGHPLTAILVSGPSAGTLVLNPDGSFVYTPGPSLTGFTDSFTYRADDGTSSSNIATVTIQVN